jgi:hypothetical protein
MILYIIFFIIFLLSVYNLKTFKNDKIACKKWQGDLVTSPSNICKDCGYPRDCHGPYVGDSWRHIFQDTPI